jgi:3-oxoadipate enol-lactonase
MSETETVLTDDGISLAWRSDGDPSLPPLLLANSLGTTMAMWAPQIPVFSATHRVIRYDMCGHGRSAVRPAGFGIDRLGQDVITLLDHLGIGQTTFAGVSLGGMVGQWLGFAAPDRIAQLVLANTSAYMPPRDAWDARIATVCAQGLAAIAPNVTARWFTPGFRAKSPVPGVIAAAMIAGAPDGYAAACAAIRDMDFRDAISAIAVPTLIIGGTEDPATPPPHSEFLAQAIPQSELAWLEAAHLANLEQSDAFAAAVAAFLVRPDLST